MSEVEIMAKLDRLEGEINALTDMVKDVLGILDIMLDKEIKYE